MTNVITKIMSIITEEQRQKVVGQLSIDLQGCVKFSCMLFFTAAFVYTHSPYIFVLSWLRTVRVLDLPLRSILHFTCFFLVLLLFFLLEGKNRIEKNDLLINFIFLICIITAKMYYKGKIASKC